MDTRPWFGTGGPASATMKLPRAVWMILLGATRPVAKLFTPGHGVCAMRLPEAAHIKDTPSTKFCVRGTKELGIRSFRFESYFFISMTLFQPVMRIGRSKPLKYFWLMAE